MCDKLLRRVIFMCAIASVRNNISALTDSFGYNCSRVNMPLWQELPLVRTQQQDEHAHSSRGDSTQPRICAAKSKQMHMHVRIRGEHASRSDTICASVCVSNHVSAYRLHQPRTVGNWYIFLNSVAVTMFTDGDTSSRVKIAYTWPRPRTVPNCCLFF